MKFSTTCNCCRCALTVTADDAYMDLGDPLKLLAAVVCNRCADLHDREHNLRHAIFELCFTLDRGVKIQRAERIRVLLSDACCKYAEVIALMQGNDTILFDEAFPQLLYDQPSKCPLILRKYRRDCARTFIPRPTLATASVPSLPYSDH